MRFKSLCLYLFLLTFCVFAFGSGSGSARPSLIFTSWQAGRGVKGGPSDAPNQLPIWSTFATHSETKCKLDVQVGYAEQQPANASKLTSYEFKVDAAISLPVCQRKI